MSDTCLKREGGRPPANEKTSKTRADGELKSEVIVIRDKV